jgi:hypothetical protein
MSKKNSCMKLRLCAGYFRRVKNFGRETNDNMHGILIVFNTSVIAHEISSRQNQRDHFLSSETLKGQKLPGVDACISCKRISIYTTIYTWPCTSFLSQQRAYAATPSPSSSEQRYLYMLRVVDAQFLLF